MTSIYWPEHQAQLYSAIHNWNQHWNYIPPEKDGIQKSNWVWTAGQWIDYQSQSDAAQLGEAPLPVFSQHLDKQKWKRWLQLAIQNWGEPNKSRVVQYEKNGGELFILPSGKQFVQRNERLWGGRLGENASLFLVKQWILKNERFSMEQYLDQRVEIQQYIWEKNNQPQYILTESLEEKGAHWYGCQVIAPNGSSLGNEWKQWLQWGGDEYKPRDSIKPFWGDYELKLNNGTPFMAYSFA